MYSWRDVLDDWQKAHGGETRIMMTEAYTNITFTMKYYQSDDGSRKGSHMPFNFLMISDLNKDSKAQDFVAVVNQWMSHMPAGETANWVVSQSTYTKRQLSRLISLRSWEITTTHVSAHATVPSVLTA